MTTSLTAHRPPGWARYTPLGLLPVAAAWFGYVLTFNPTDTRADPTGPCPWHRAFGIDGPTCGITRMTWYLLHGDLLDAARMHLAALLLVPVGVYGYLWWAGGWILGTKLPTVRIAKPWVVGYVAFFLVYAIVVRNLPWPPFTWFYVPDLTP